MKDFNNISILSWNIRGAANCMAKRHVKDLVRKYHPTFFFVLETYVQFSVMASFWRGLGYSAIAVVEVAGHAGGIWVLQCGDFDTEILDFFSSGY